MSAKRKRDDLPQLAEEMRTLVEMLNRRYHNPRAEAEGAAWSGVRPGDPIDDGNCVTLSRIADFRITASA